MGGKVVNIHYAKTHLSRLVREVVDGQEVIIARDNDPVARLVPIGKAPGRRVLGTAKGLAELKESFDEPLEEFVDYV